MEAIPFPSLLLEKLFTNLLIYFLYKHTKISIIKYKNKLPIYKKKKIGQAATYWVCRFAPLYRRRTSLRFINTNDRRDRQRSPGLGTRSLVTASVVTYAQAPTISNPSGPRYIRVCKPLSGFHIHILVHVPCKIPAYTNFR